MISFNMAWTILFLNLSMVFKSPVTHYVDGEATRNKYWLLGVAS